ncbi:hypothetical protein SK128_027897 [Halocaridina rubra]|uniref:UDP-D-xylose:beta-D-glucoside alpha-1,3-D-xylosyltransferase n=1 Tax=Halocaridina rubra TaxID=373956 RepID=A0AAN8X4T9_HALRR
MKDNPSIKSPLVIVVCDSYSNETIKFGRRKTKDENDKENLKHVKEEEEELLALRRSWVRQGQQISTLLKTLLYFGHSSKWRVIVMTDTRATFKKVQNLTHSFPDVYKRQLMLEHRLLRYPEGYPELKNHWRPCAWGKQFLAESLPDEDAVVYVDSDLVFLSRPEELWWMLESMSPTQLIAVGPEPYYQMEDNKRYFAGTVGLNTGVMAINLTRARHLPGGGIGTAILKEGVIKPWPRHDQDALNHFLMFKPHLLLEVTSRWNFLPSACMAKAPPCPDCISSGILILHGADMSFYRAIDAKFMVIYAVLVNTPIGMTPEALLGQLSGQLALTDTIKLPYPCNNYTNINDALTFGLTNLAIELMEKTKPKRKNSVR